MQVIKGGIDPIEESKLYNTLIECLNTLEISKSQKNDIIIDFDNLSNMNDNKINFINSFLINYNISQEIFNQIKDNIIIKENLKEISEFVKTSLIMKKRDEASEEVVEYIQRNNSIYTTRNDEKSEIWIYQDGIYKPNGKTYIKEICRKILDQVFTTHFYNLVVAKIEADSYILQEELFDNNYKDIVPVLNGLLNIKTRNLSPFTPDLIFFQKIPITYDENATCDDVINFIKDVIEHEEDLIVLQELFGYCLYKEFPIEKAFMLLGKGRNGKGQIIELIKTFIGVDNASSVSLQRLTDDSSFDIAELHTKMVNLGGDIPSEFIKNTGVFKSLTSWEYVSAKRKFMTDIKFRNYAKMVFACNELPKSSDRSLAWWDRWVLMKFPYRFVYQEVYNKTPEEDREFLKIRKNNVAENLCTEENLSGVLNWALEGLNRLLSQEHFTFTRSTENIQERWIKESDSFAAFCKENIEEEWDVYIKKEELRHVYNNYCKKNKLNTVGDKAIKNYITKEVGASEDRYRIDSEQIPIWRNIKFGKGGMDGKGFSTYIREKNSYMSEKTSTKPTKPTNLLIKSKPVYNNINLKPYILESIGNKGAYFSNILDQLGTEKEDEISKYVDLMLTNGDIFEKSFGFFMKTK